MRIIKNLVEIDFKNKDGDFLLVNGINGYIDLIHKREKTILDLWKKTEKIIPCDNVEKVLYDKLKSRNYIMTAQDEDEQKSHVINTLYSKINHGVSAQTAWFVLTYNCNFNCPYCYEGQNNSKSIMTFEMIDRIFEVNTNIKKIGFFGGEPLLLSNRKVIEYIISKASTSTQYYVITNGYYLEEYIDILKSIDVRNIQVTLDGSESKHNETRCLHNGGPTYEKIINGVKLCVANNIPVKIRMNISLDNMEDCFREKKRIEETDWGKSVRFEMQQLFQTEGEDLKTISDNLFVEDNRNNSKVNQILKKSLPLSNFLYNGIPLRPILRTCDREGQARFYDADGNIYNCILAVGNKSKSIGTYFPQVQLKEKSFLTRDITKIPQCMECPYALLCGGGCSNGVPEDKDLYSPNCYSFIREIEYMVPQIYKLKYDKSARNNN